MFTCSKKYTGLPFAHRQHNHKGHCALIHGHNWAFQFTFIAVDGRGAPISDFDRLVAHDPNGFVIDFGDLKWLKRWLDEHFDHTLVLNAEDPALEYLRDGLTNRSGAAPEVTERFPFAKIIVVPNCGAEGLAVWVFDEVDKLLQLQTQGKVRLHSIVVEEDEKNCAAYAPSFGGCCHE